MKIHVSSGKRLSQAKVMTAGSSCRFYEVGTLLNLQTVS